MDTPSSTEETQAPLGGPVFGTVKAKVHEKRSFFIPVSGAPDVRATETVTINPDRLTFTFQRDYKQGEPPPPWDTPYPRVYGPRRLRDGSLSDKSMHEQRFFMDKHTPQWILDQVEKHRPQD